MSVVYVVVMVLQMVHVIVMVVLILAVVVVKLVHQVAMSWRSSSVNASKPFSAITASNAMR